MFGGVGLYAGSVFFGIIWKDDLYFKTNESSRKRYIQAGMEPFSPSSKQVLKSYYQVPGNILENQDDIVSWAKEAIRLAQS
jgi:DNA transformation protein